MGSNFLPNIGFANEMLRNKWASAYAPDKLKVRPNVGHPLSDVGPNLGAVTRGDRLQTRRS